VPADTLAAITLTCLMFIYLDSLSLLQLARSSELPFLRLLSTADHDSNNREDPYRVKW